VPLQAYSGPLFLLPLDPQSLSQRLNWPGGLDFSHLPQVLFLEAAEPSPSSNSLEDSGRIEGG
jgi:hypothetical protein